MKKLITVYLAAFIGLFCTSSMYSANFSIERIAGNVALSAFNHTLEGIPGNFNPGSLNWGKFESRRGGSFGGRRGGSFGRSRSSRPSFGSRRSSRSNPQSFRRSAPRRDPMKTPSFGGRRMTTSEARMKYGAPRRVENFSGRNESGMPMNYRVNNYGGFTSGLMMGYLSGHMASSWMYGARFFYTRPIYVENPDGTVDIYPPTFDVGKVFFSLIILIAIIIFIRRALLGASNKNARSRYGSQSSFS